MDPRKKKSVVWKYFKKNEADSEVAECLNCKLVLKVKMSSVYTLLKSETFFKSIIYYRTLMNSLF